MSEAQAPQGAAGTAGEGGTGAGEQSWEQIRNDAIKADPPTKVDAGSKAELSKAEPEKKVPVAEWERVKAKKAAVAKREMAVQAREEEGKRSVEALEKRTTELEERGKTLDKLESDPKAFLDHFAKKLNMSPAKVLNALNDYFLEQKNPAELEVAKIRQEREEEKRQAAEAKKKADEDAAEQASTAKVRAYLGKIAEYVADPKVAEKYTFIPTYEPSRVANAAWARIVKHHETTGQNIPLDKILDILETEEEAEYLKKEERRKSRLSGQSQDPARGGSAGKPAADEAQRPTTLNHRLAGQRTPQARGVSDQDDWEEAKRQAGVQR